jgi:hypothetical protein
MFIGITYRLIYCNLAVCPFKVSEEGYFCKYVRILSILGPVAVSKFTEASITLSFEFL